MDKLYELIRSCRHSPMNLDIIRLEDILRLLAAVGMILQLLQLIIRLRDTESKDIPWDDILKKEDS